MCLTSCLVCCNAIKSCEAMSELHVRHTNVSVGCERNGARQRPLIVDRYSSTSQIVWLSPPSNRGPPPPNTETDEFFECGTTALRYTLCFREPGHAGSDNYSSTNQATRGPIYPSIWLRIEALLEMSVRDWPRGTRETEYRSEKA